MKVDQFSKKKQHSQFILSFCKQKKKSATKEGCTQVLHTLTHTPMKLITIKRNDYEKTLLKRKANIIETN